MTTAVADRTIGTVAHEYLQTCEGAKSFFKIAKTICDTANYAGTGTRISENVKDLAENAGSALDVVEVPVKLRDAAYKIAKWYNEGFGINLNLAELTAKVSRFAACVFKCLEYFTKKGILIMWDSNILKSWANRFSAVQFGWGVCKALGDLAKEIPANADEDLANKTSNLSLIKLVFNASILTLVTAGPLALLSPLGALVCSSTALASSIGMEFYGKLNGLD